MSKVGKWREREGVKESSCTPRLRGLMCLYEGGGREGTKGINLFFEKNKTSCVCFVLFCFVLQLYVVLWPNSQQ